MKTNDNWSLWEEDLQKISQDGYPMDIMEKLFDINQKKKPLYPIDGKLSKFFKKDAPNDKIKLELTGEQLLSLIYPEGSRNISLDNICNYWNVGFTGFDFEESTRLTKNDTLAELIKNYRTSGEISPDLEHKLIWLYPPFAEALGLDNISYAGKIIYLTKRPGSIRNFKKSTTEMQMIAVKSSWDLIKCIKRPHREVLEYAAEKAINSYESKAKSLREWNKGELPDYEKEGLLKDYAFFNKYSFNPVIKQDILGTIMSICLEHEMDSFIG